MILTCSLDWTTAKNSGSPLSSLRLFQVLLGIAGPQAQMVDRLGWGLRSSPQLPVSAQLQQDPLPSQQGPQLAMVRAAQTAGVTAVQLAGSRQADPGSLWDAKQVGLRGRGGVGSAVLGAA
jgi:hypothetical protein